MSEPNLPFFESMNRNMRENIEKVFDKKALAAGEVLCKEGDKGDSMYIILSGSVEVLRAKRREGKEEVAAVVDAGHVVGELSLVDASPRNATVRGKEAGEVLVVTKSRIEKLKKDDPLSVFALYESLLTAIAARFRSVQDKKDVFSFWLS